MERATGRWRTSSLAWRPGSFVVPGRRFPARRPSRQERNTLPVGENAGPSSARKDGGCPADIPTQPARSRTPCASPRPVYLYSARTSAAAPERSPAWTTRRSPPGSSRGGKAESALRTSLTACSTTTGDCRRKTSGLEDAPPWPAPAAGCGGPAPKGPRRRPPPPSPGPSHRVRRDHGPPDPPQRPAALREREPPRPEPRTPSPPAVRSTRRGSRERPPIRPKPA